MSTGRLWGQGIDVTRGGVQVLRGLAFSVAGGQALVLTGPNGAGKTTLLRAICGLNRLESGEISYRDGQGQTGEDGPALGECCHFVGHLPAVNGRLTVAENLDFWRGYLAGDTAGPAAGPSAGASTASWTAALTVGDALEAVGLAALAGLSADVLSAGQRRRLALARLYVSPRPIWLLDEPTTALDAASSAALFATVNRHTERGGIAVVATHQPLGLARTQDLVLSALAPSPAPAPLWI